MKADSLDLRTRVVEARDRHGGTPQAVATLWGGSCPLIKTLLGQRRERGTLAPKPPAGGQVATLEEAERETGRASMLRTRNEATVREEHTDGATTSLTCSTGTNARRWRG